ncbi:hypothetical protein [Zhihengliuella sp. ISTPL4]|uniref:hypothetical protein n=1 Tax=Zhihengliuella sp. ISTPL4 TaxID=2058657 RepID=UPI0025710365|nr:hypothetical protein [Zhihengliuella sp. ISTPL4]
MTDAEMTKADRADLAIRIETALRACSGVRGVYRSGSLVSHLVRAGAAAWGNERGAEPIVSVAAGADGVEVEAAIGADGRVASVATLRHACDAVDAVLRADGLRRGRLTLTVAYVQSAGEPAPGERRRP